jgi:mRNA interferase RelE/StbE
LNSYRIFETDRFGQDLSGDFSGHRERIRSKLHTYVYPQLAINPYFGKNIRKLAGYKPDTWRYRIGDYRFFYSIDENRKIVFMLAIDHRGSAYR